MRIGIRAHDVEPLPFEALISRIKEQGFYCTQLALKKAVRDFSVEGDALTPGLAMHIKHIFDANKVDIAVMGCYLNLANPNEGQLAKITEYYKSTIRFASWLGVGVVGTETGAPNETYEFEPACHSEQSLELLIENLRPVVSYAEKMGVIFAIEPVYNHIVCDAKRARSVLDKINSPCLQIILDPVNLLSMNNYKGQDQVMEEAFELLGADIAIIHAKDFIIEDNKIKSVPAGFGNLHYNVLMKYIKEHKPYIQVLLEDTKPKCALRSKAFVEEHYQLA